MENTGQGSLQPSYRYVWSLRYIDAAVLRDENTDSDSTCDDGRIYYLEDANSNVTTIVDTSGDTLERYVYSPYGVLAIYDATWSSIRSASNYDIAYTYPGRRYDKETGLYYYRHRVYHAGLGRFISRDPIGYRAGASLFRAYFIPNRMDPDGRRVLSHNETECVANCQRGCGEEYGWWNPQRYICSRYCQSLCTHTPDMFDRAYSVCPLLRQTARIHNCLCSIFQVADSVSGIGQNPVVISVDEACTFLTTAVAACDAADTGTFLGWLGASSQAGLAIFDLVAEWDPTQLGDGVVAVAQNMLQTGNPVGPQRECLCQLRAGGRAMVNRFLDAWRDIERTLRQGRLLPF